MTEPLDTDINAGNMELRTSEASEVVTERGADEERGGSDNPLTQQNSVSDDVPEDPEEDSKGTSNSDLFCLIFSLVSMAGDYCLDGINTYEFYTRGNTVFFVLSLVFTVGPAFFLHIYATIALKPSGWKAPLCFLFSPWVLTLKVICLHIKGNNTKEQKGLKKSLNNVKVVEGFFEAVPQLFIQMTAWRIGILEDSAVIFSYVKMVLSCISASLALLSVFCEEMNKYLQGVFVFFVALVLGSRVFVCASLFSLDGPLLCMGFLPPAISLLLAWVTDYVFKREKVSINRAYIKATLLPPEDKAGVVASLVYCNFGFLFWLLTMSQPLNVFVFVGVTVAHILGGSGWMILKLCGQKYCMGEGKCSCLT
ncbi:uncharacterized protein LOC134765562 [Penaeus indicus]|uniref:uncharacterized protein LOC134765562 n=1 Tax=Penaeus indicus TaxID=29960 RepID=UPI00300DB289